jgi:acetyltransferase-like isoleucine patch superfamily enzyme
MNNEIIIIDGEKQHILLDSSTIDGLTIEFCGENNRVIIEAPFKFFNSLINFSGNHSHIEILKPKYIQGLRISCTESWSKLLWKEGGISYGINIFLHEHKSTVLIGRDCLFASGIDIWPTDGHSIFDINSNELINEMKSPVVIGDYVWIGYRVLITKKTYIPNGSVVAAGSVVTRAFYDENIVIAGNPAKIIKRDVLWNHLSPNEYLRVNRANDDFHFDF